LWSAASIRPSRDYFVTGLKCRRSGGGQVALAAEKVDLLLVAFDFSFGAKLQRDARPRRPQQNTRVRAASSSTFD
jgi:hypothetical protein